MIGLYCYRIVRQFEKEAAMKKNVAVFMTHVLTVTILVGYLTSCGGGGGSAPPPPSSAKSITAFSFTSPAVMGMIGQSANTILVNVPAGTDVTALVATFSTTGSSVKVGSEAQVSGVTPNDFTSPVIYTVTAADGSFQNYLVTVRAGALPPQWARTVTAGSSNSVFRGVCATTDGSVYAAGSIDGTGIYSFGNSVTAAGTSGSGNVVLVKYDSSGVAQWARTMAAGNSYSEFNNVSVASDGSVYAAGMITGTGTFDFSNNVTAAAGSSGENIVLVKYNSSGMAQWARTATAGTESYFSSVAVSSDGSVYAAGGISGTGTYDFGNGVTAAGTNSSSNIVLVKYNSSGVAQWARTMTAGVIDAYFISVSVSSDGSVYAAGYITGTGTYGFGNSITATGAVSGENIILVKYDSSGTAQWARTVTAGSDQSWFYSVSTAKDGSVYAAGSIEGTGTFDFGNSVTAAGTYGSWNIVLVKYNSSGAAQWARTVTAGSSISSFSGVSTAADGSTYAAGNIAGTGTYNFGNSVTAAGTHSGGSNIVLVKYNSSGVAQWAQTVTAGSSISSFSGVSTASDGSTYAAGYIDGTGTYDFGNSITATGTYSGGSNIVLVKYY